MSGRASGRARGRPSSGTGSPDSEMMQSSPESGSPVAAAAGANRGRGGFRSESLLVTRPPNTTDATGSKGTKVSLFANYFKVQTDDALVVYDYRVDFDPEIESVKVRKLLVTKVAEYFRNASGQPAYLFDGQHNLKSMARLEAEVTEATVVNEQTQQSVRILFKRSEEPIAWGSFEMMRLYNTQMRRNFQHLNWMLIYRDYYNPEQEIKIPQYQLNVMMGLTTAINQHEAGILVAAESINKIIRTETVLTVMRKVHAQGGNFQDNVRRELVGSIVMTKYNNRTYKIDDIDFTKNPNSQFERRGVGMVTFAAYYQEQYQLNIADRGQPLIVCMPSTRDKRIAEQRGQQATTHLLIPEFCVMTGLSESMRSNFDLKKQLTQATQLPPSERFKQLMNFRKALQQNAAVQSDLSVWNITYGSGPLTVAGRIMDREKLLMDGTGPTGKPMSDAGDFSRDMRGHKMLGIVNWQEWLVLYPGREAPVVDAFLTCLQRVSAGLGLNLTPPQRQPLPDDRTQSYLEKLKSWVGSGKAVGLAITIFPNSNADRYSAVKKLCCIEQPVASQAIMSKTLQNERARMSVATKICLQMAVKLGSQPWAVEIPAKDVMVIGYDTYHDGTRRGESVGAFVSSLNAFISKFFSKVDYHKDRTEMSNHITTNFRLALDKYEEVNKKAPSRVILFRDGVGDGMLRHVFEVEVAGLKTVIEQRSGTDAAGQIQLAVVVVTKRTNTKFFLKNKQQEKLENPPPGTVVDTDVTRPERLEFFLVAQSVRHGTVAPVNFNVIYNTTRFKAEHFQQLSYKLCHMYYNWPGTIRVPAPCQYAHKLAFLTGTALHREPNAHLSQRLFFL